MTYSKSVHVERCPNLDKGSTHGITSRWFGHHSFQGSQRGCGFSYSNRTEVLSGEATIFSLQVAGTIVGNEAEEPTSQCSEVRANLPAPVLSSRHGY
jgi:hypothetical protein